MLNRAESSHKLVGCRLAGGCLQRCQLVSDFWETVGAREALQVKVQATLVEAVVFRRAADVLQA